MRLQGRAVESLVDITRDRRRLEQLQPVMLEGRYLREGMQGAIPIGRSALGEDVDRHEVVLDLLFHEREPRDADIDAVVGAVEGRLRLLAHAWLRWHGHNSMKRAGRSRARFAGRPGARATPRLATRKSAGFVKCGYGCFRPIDLHGVRYEWRNGMGSLRSASEARFEPHPRTPRRGAGYGPPGRDRLPVVLSLASDLPRHLRRNGCRHGQAPEAAPRRRRYRGDGSECRRDCKAVWLSQCPVVQPHLQGRLRHAAGALPERGKPHAV